jgi:Domain of unknown function (DUF4939)
MAARQTRNSQRAGLPTNNPEASTSAGPSAPDEFFDLPPPTNPSQSPNMENNLAEALTLLARNIKGPNKPSSKIREPDTFDGSDSRKLQPFIVQCTLNFRDRPNAFPTDSEKITYMLSYLKGTALAWFEPGLLAEDTPAWLENLDLFISELQVNFGPFDPEGEAEAELDKLQMRDNHKATKYLVEFQRLAARVEWGDAALRRQLYKGLPDRIKDDIARVGKPNKLSELRAMIQAFDARYWERRSEITRDSAKTERSNDKGKSVQTSNTNDRKTQHSGKPNPNNSGNSGKSGNSSNNSGNAKKPSDLSTKLGSDGKLTAEERKRRYENNLCLFCGRTGHVAKECSRATSSAAKARAASTSNSKTTTDKTSEAKSASESKNQ